MKIEFPKIFKPLDQPYRYKVMHGGRGSSKSWTVARKILIRCLQKKIRVLCTRELQKSIKQSVHKLLSLQIDKMGLQKAFKIENDKITSINGSEILFIGVRHNVEEIKSTEGIDICWIEEAHSITETSFGIIDPTIRQDGSEIWITYNPRFKFDHIHKMFVIDEPPANSWVQEVNHDDNPWFPEVLRVQMEQMKEKDYEKYLHIWEGQLRRLADGAIFGTQIAKIHKDKRLTFIPIQPNCEVHTFFDIGKNDHTAIWFMQKVGPEYRFIDYYQARLEEVEHYTKHLKSLDYLYGTHHLPHDADHDRLGMTRNIKQQFEDGGIRPIEIVERIAHKATAIELAREKLAMCWFHKGDDERGRRVAIGYDALCNYRYKFKDDDNTFQLTPHHDWSSNGADAFQQFAQTELSDYTGWDTPIEYPNIGII